MVGNQPLLDLDQPGLNSDNGEAARAVGFAFGRHVLQRWRDERRVQVIATNYRLLGNTDQGWQNYWYRDVTAFYPDLDRWSITLAFDGYAPLRLSGPAAPALCLWTATAVLGERWVSDPRMARLLQ